MNAFKMTIILTALFSTIAIAVGFIDSRIWISVLGVFVFMMNFFHLQLYPLDRWKTLEELDEMRRRLNNIERKWMEKLRGE